MINQPRPVTGGLTHQGGKLPQKIYQPTQTFIHHGSYWPLISALGVGFLPTGLLVFVWGGKLGLLILALGGAITLLGIGGWTHTLVREKLIVSSVSPIVSGASGAELRDSGKWSESAHHKQNLKESGLKNSVKLFLVSETAVFGALFAHHFYSRAHFPIWPPAGAPELATRIPAIATLILMSSSFTIKWAHSALQKGKQVACQWLVLLTILLGVAFLSAQGYEWGFLKAFDQFTQKSGTFGTSFYMMTGFHGLHVSMGLIVLALTYIRLRLGHFDPHNHFFFTASSWYWHFVDVVWIFLFGTIYLV